MNYFYNSNNSGGCLGGCLLMLLMLLILPFVLIYKLISGKSVSMPNMWNRESRKEDKVNDKQFQADNNAPASEAIIDVKAKEVD